MSELGPLQAPENKAQREKCERAKAYLDDNPYRPGDWDLPSKVVETDHDVARVWFIYENTWIGDDSPNFSFHICIPIYAVWGRKKREKYLKQRNQK